MANENFWTCHECGYSENSVLDDICENCGKPRPEEKEHSKSRSRVRIGGHFSKIYYLVMVLLLVGAILFCILTPTGKRWIRNINLGLVMNFSTTSMDKMGTTLAWLGAILVIGGAIWGAAEMDTFIGGAIVGFLAYLAILGIIVLFINFVLPLAVNVVAYFFIVAISLAFALGSSVALVNYIKKFLLYRNPYPKTVGIYEDDDRKYYEDKTKRKEEYAQRRNYFFGPGLFSVRQTIISAWQANFEAIKGSFETIKDRGKFAWLIWIIPFLFFTLSVGIFGSIVTLSCSLLHIAFIIPIMAIIFVLFTVTWGIDRLFLLLRSITTVCPVCQSRSVIPYFRCSNPECRKIHRRLVPSPYGIWHRKCECGKTLPTMFLLGRSKLEGICPKCGGAEVLTSTDSMPFTISMIGGTSSGKTTLLSAYWHEFFSRAETQKDKFEYSIPQTNDNTRKFNNLNSLFRGTESNATNIQRNTAIPYTVLLTPLAVKKKIEYTIYDIMGEVFNNEDLHNIRTQFQFSDSNGLVFVIDPLSSSKMNKAAVDEGDEVKNASTIDPQKVMINFTNYLTNVLTNKSIGDRIQKPAAVVITKADLPSIRKKISYTKIKYTMQQNPSAFKDFEDAKNHECKAFLEEIGFSSLVERLERSFSHVQYFPISAIGHEENGEEYEPEHVLEPFDWILREANPKLSKELLSDDSTN